MSRDCFKPLKDFDLYEINSKGDVRKRTTKRMLTAQKTKTGDRYFLYDSGHALTISRSKLAYCYQHNTSPYEIRDKVISEGVLMSVSQHCKKLLLLNQERLECIAKDKEREDLIFQYERSISFLNNMLALLKGELTNEGAVALNEDVTNCIRKAMVRYYCDKKEYRKEEIEDIARQVFYSCFLSHCPLNIDCYVYEIVKRKFGNKKG